MIYINDEKINMATIVAAVDKPHPNVAVNMLAAGYKELLSLGFPIKFKLASKLWRVHKESGYKEYKGMIAIMLTAVIPTVQGSLKVVYCEDATPIPGGGFKYSPRRFKFTKISYTFHEEDIELCLFLKVFSPEVNKSHQIVLEDREREARGLATQRASSSALFFYIYNEASVLFSDKDKLVTLARAWGIARPEKLGDSQLRNALFDAVELGEYQQDINYNHKAFADAVKNISPFINVTAHIQQAIDMKLLDFHESNFSWRLSTPDGVVIKTLTRVNPVEVSKKRDSLAAYLTANPEDYDLLKTSMFGIGKKEAAVANTSFDTTVKAHTADEITAMTHAQRMSIAKNYGVNPVGMGKDDLLSAIITKITPAMKE